MMLNTVDTKTAWAAYSGWFPYSSANRELFLDVGKELAMSNDWAIVPSSFNVKIMRIAIHGERMSRPIRLRTSGSENRLIFRNAHCAPSVTSAIAKNAFDVFLIGVHRKAGILTETTWKNTPNKKA